MPILSLIFNRTVGRPLYQAVGNAFADLVDATDQERATIVNTATVVGSVGAAIVCMEAAGVVDALASVGDLADVADAADAADAATTGASVAADVSDHASAASDVQFGSYYHDPYNHPLPTPNVNGDSVGPDGTIYHFGGGTWEGQPRT